MQKIADRCWLTLLVNCHFVAVDFDFRLGVLETCEMSEGFDKICRYGMQLNRQWKSRDCGWPIVLDVEMNGRSESHGHMFSCHPATKILYPAFQILVGKGRSNGRIFPHPHQTDNKNKLVTLQLHLQSRSFGASTSHTEARLQTLGLNFTQNPAVQQPFKPVLNDLQTVWQCSLVHITQCCTKCCKQAWTTEKW